jgi:hypothetical protein
MRVARVIELPASESFAQAAELVLSGQVRPRITRKHFVEQPDMIGYLTRVLLVGRSRQDDAPAGRTLLSQIRDDLVVIGEHRRVQIDLLRDFLLEAGPTATQLQQGHRRAKRAALNQSQE